MKRYIASLMAAVILALGALSNASANEIIVYSARQEHLIKPLFDLYTQETGIEVKYFTGKAGALMQRIKAEGSRTRADILLTVDAGNLWHAASEGLLQPVKSRVLEANIPSHLRDPENRWFGLSVRARTIVYNTDRVSPEELSTYEDLGNPKWKGRLVLRTSKKVYNQSLTAMFIAEFGLSKTEEIIRSWVDNLSTEPFSSDTKVLEAIAAGQGDVGIINTYYFGRLMKKKSGLPLALFWPDQDGNGVHVNISGAGVTTYARHRDEAIKFLEWLSAPAAQTIFADSNMEYPVHRDAELHPIVKSWGSFKRNLINVSKSGELQIEAIMLMDRAGYR
ncbi:MAG: Fe(3+) ABC transporter substrate-binding protein [bacterium]